MLSSLIACAVCLVVGAYFSTQIKSFTVGMLAKAKDYMKAQADKAIAYVKSKV